MKRICSGAGRSRQQPRVGAPDPALTPNAGLAVITELCGRLGVISALAGEGFLTGLDRQRADAAGQQMMPVPGLASTAAAGLARRVTPVQWQLVETGLAAVTGRMLEMLPAPVTIDLDTTDVGGFTAARSGAWPVTIRVSGSAGRTWRAGPRPGSCWPRTWATAPMTRGRPCRTWVKFVDNLFDEIGL